MPSPRIAFADANWLVAVYHQTRHEATVQQWARGGPSTLMVSAPLLAEARCTFWRLGDRWPVLAADVKSGRYTDCGYPFETLVTLADDLVRRYAPRCDVGTLDLLHLAAARRFGCRWFLSFDSHSGCRALASVLGMKVFPDLNKGDREWVRKLKG